MFFSSLLLNFELVALRDGINTHSYSLSDALQFCISAQTLIIRSLRELVDDFFFTFTLKPLVKHKDIVLNMDCIQIQLIETFDLEVGFIGTWSL